MTTNDLPAAIDDFLHVPVDPSRNPAAVYLSGLAPGSRRTQSTALNTMAGLLSGDRSTACSIPWHLVGYQHTQALRAVLADRFSPATANRHLSALRGVLREAWRLGLVSAEDLARAVDLPSVRGERLPRGRALSRGELSSLFGTCRGGKAADVRDAGLMAILYAAGLRRAEVVMLDLKDYNLETGGLMVRGKGNKDRMTFIDNGAADAVRAWLALRGEEPGPLFVPVSQTGMMGSRRMTDQAIYAILRSRAIKAEVKAFSPHDLRRSCVSDLLDAGVDISVVQRFVGHANVTTTARYDRREEHAKRKAAKSLHVPFVSPESAD